jgi:hypothetical protein
MQRIAVVMLGLSHRSSPADQCGRDCNGDDHFRVKCQLSFPSVNTYSRHTVQLHIPTSGESGSQAEIIATPVRVCNISSVS